MEEKVSSVKKWFYGDPSSPNQAEREGILARKQDRLRDLAQNGTLGMVAQEGQIDLDHGLTIEHLSRATGLTRQIIYYWITGERTPTVESIAKICKVLDEPLENALKIVETTKIGKPRGLGSSTREVHLR